MGGKISRFITQLGYKCTHYEYDLSSPHRHLLPQAIEYRGTTMSNYDATGSVSDREADDLLQLA